jgi:Fe-S-cluster containining protein
MAKDIGKSNLLGFPFLPDNQRNDVDYWRRKMSFEYPEKVRFKCIKCGICCGDTQERTRHILLLDEEAKNIAATTNQRIPDFASRLDDKTLYHYEIKKTENDGKCVFLKENRCIIYYKRPLICKFYPFGFRTTQKQQEVFYFTNECPGVGKGNTMREEDFRKLLKQAKKRTMTKRGKARVET